MFRQPIWLTLIHSGLTHCSHYSSEKVIWTEGEVMKQTKSTFIMEKNECLNLLLQYDSIIHFPAC